MQKRLRQLLLWCLGLCGAVLLLGALATPVINNLTADRLERDLRALTLPEKTVPVASVSKAGKLTGSGNGMQYFAAVLLQSELSAQALEEFYAPLRTQEWELAVIRQSDARGDFWDRDAALRFAEVAPDGEGNFILFSWGSGIAPFDTLDLRGH